MEQKRKILMEANWEEIGKRIRKLRKEQGFTQAELAELVGIELSFMGHIERAGRAASVNTLISIAYALNTDVQYLLFGELSPNMFPNRSVNMFSKLNAKQREVLYKFLKVLTEYPEDWKF